MTPERLEQLRQASRDGYLIPASELLDEVDRLRAGIEALTEDPTWHRGMYGCPRDMVSTDRLLALLSPTEGETDE